LQAEFWPQMIFTPGQDRLGALLYVGASTEIEMTEELVVKSVKLTGGRHLAVHLSNRADVAVGIGNLRYTLTDKAGNSGDHSTPNATPVHPGETVEIFVEVHESVRSLDFIGYELQSARIIPVQGRAEAGFWRWSLKIR
jgi:hypothetical protein